MRPNKSGFAHEIQVSWLHKSDVKIRDTFVHEYTPVRYEGIYRNTTISMNHEYLKAERQFN